MSPEQIEAWIKLIYAACVALIVLSFALAFLVFSFSFAHGFFDPIVDNKQLFAVVPHMLEMVVLALSNIVVFKLGQGKKND